ncbi:hypothetical protein A4U61_07260 [Streptomyces sp. H-KF8]|nr:hypothetical protein A4U61_07260 [Streptomyces sp. H-KF8]
MTPTARLTRTQPRPLPRRQIQADSTLQGTQGRHGTPVFGSGCLSNEFPMDGSHVPAPYRQPGA